MGRKRWLAAGTSAMGCTGCLGVVALGAVAVVGVGLAGLYTVQQQWESTLRGVLDHQTGGEVELGALRLGWGRVALLDLIVRDSTGEPVLTVGRTVLYADPWVLAESSERWELRGLSLQDVALTPHRTDDGFALPVRTLGLLRGDRTEQLRDVVLPEVVVPRVELSSVIATLDGHRVVVEDAALTGGLSVTFVPEATLALGEVTAEGLTIEGPGVVTVAAATATLPASLSALDTTAVLSDVVLTDLGLALGELSAAAAETHATSEVSVSWAGEPSVEAGRWTASGVRVEGGTRATVATATVDVDGLLDLHSEAIELSSVALASVRSSPGPAGWTLVDRAFAATAGHGLPPVTVSSLVIDDVVLSVPDAQVEASARRLRTSAVLTPGVRVDWQPLELDEVAVRVEGDERVAATSLTVRAGGLGARDEQLSLGTVTASGVRAKAAWGQTAFGIPAALFRIGGVRGGLHVGVLEVSDVDLTVDAASGTLPVRARGGRLDDLVISPEGWELGGAELIDVEARDDQRRATATRVVLQPGGTVEIGTAEVWTRLDRKRMLRLPAVARDHTPTWVGGSWAGQGDYFGVAFPGTPWAPTRLSAPNLTVHLVDGGIASSETTWDIPMAVTLGPHKANGNLPVELSGTFAGGSFAGSGRIEPAGRVVLKLDAQKLKLRQLGPYLDEPLARLGVEVKRGQADADLTIDLRGSVVSATGRGTARNLELGGKLGPVASVGFDVAAGSDGEMSLPVDVSGDLADPGFSLVDSLIASYVGGLGSVFDRGDLEHIGSTLGDLVDAATGARGGGKGKGKGDGDGKVKKVADDAGKEVEQAAEQVGDAIKDLFGGGKGKKKKK